MIHSAYRPLHFSIQRSNSENIRSAIQEITDLIGGETRTEGLCFGLQHWKETQRRTYCCREILNRKTCLTITIHFSLKHRMEAVIFQSAEKTRRLHTMMHDKNDHIKDHTVLSYGSLWMYQIIMICPDVYKEMSCINMVFGFLCAVS